MSYFRALFPLVTYRYEHKLLIIKCRKQVGSTGKMLGWRKRWLVAGAAGEGWLMRNGRIYITGIWDEKPKWEAKPKTDSHASLETDLYLAFYCTMICEHWCMGMSSTRDKFWKEKC